jgi:putative ABC transport system substrate-binding protein
MATAAFAGRTGVTDHLDRRALLALIAGAAAFPCAARSQQDARVRRVGVLMPFDESDPEAQARLQMFRQTMAGLGWAEGRNLRIDVLADEVIE